jgi:hypothetical protein
MSDKKRKEGMPVQLYCNNTEKTAKHCGCLACGFAAN